MNRQWHQAHVLGQHARLEERLAWHEEHARLCHCRDMPESIARELAARTYETGTNHQILVVEKRSWYGEEASGNCAGLITKHGVPEVYGPLLELSLKCWAEQLADKDFRDNIQYVPNSIVHVKSKAEGRSDHTANPPSWYNTQPEDVFKSYGSDVGKM